MLMKLGKIAAWQLFLESQLTRHKNCMRAFHQLIGESLEATLVKNVDGKSDA